MTYFMKPTALAILFGLAFMPFALNAAHHEDTTEQSREIAYALFEAFNAHDVEALVAMYSEDTKIRSPGDTEPRYGHAVVREIYQGHFDNIPGVHDAVQNVVAEGNKAAVEFIASWEQPRADDPDARGALRISTFLTIENGLIVADITYYDRMDLSPASGAGQPE